MKTPLSLPPLRHIRTTFEDPVVGPLEIRIRYGWIRPAVGPPLLEIAADVYQGRHWRLCGELSGLIREHCQELAELVHFHGCTPDGLPLHYHRNAVYWAEFVLGISRWQAVTPIPNGCASFADALAGHLRADALGDRADMTRILETVRELHKCGATRDDYWKPFDAWLKDRTIRLAARFAELLAAHNLPKPAYRPRPR